MTMRIRLTIGTLVCLMASALSSSAQNALSFTRIDRNPRSSAMAGAGAASVSSGWYSAFGQAARLGFRQDKVDGGVGVQLWEPNNDVDKSTNLSAGAAVKLGRFSVALGGAYQMGVSGPQDSFTPSDRLLSLGAAYNIADVVSVGLNARYAAQGLTSEVSVDGYSFDLTVVGRISPALSAAVGVGNIGTKVNGSNAYFGQPAYACAGLAWVLAPASVHRCELLLDGEYNFDGTLALTVGAEYAYNKTFYARAGYRIAGEKAPIPSHLGVGLGLRYSFLRLEASYLTASPILGNTVNLGVAFTL